MPTLYEHPDNFKTTTTSEIEREANNFALELIIPARVLSYAISERGYTTLDSLAALFGVSEVAMLTRLKQLGIC